MLHITNTSPIGIIKDYLRLTKPRVNSLVVFTTLAGMVIAPISASRFLILITLLTVYLGAGASAAFNMWYERDLDRLMSRTKNRPVAAGRISPRAALGFSLILAILSLILTTRYLNSLATGALIFCILFYCLVYTAILKRSTAQNIVIGGLAGAIPPVIGWTAVMNQISLEPLLLSLIIFCWTPPHFWALAIHLDNDYRAAKLPMLPSLSGIQQTKLTIIIYTILTFLASLLPYLLGSAQAFYLLVAIILGLIFSKYAINLFLSQHHGISKKLFVFSIWYLFLLFAALMIDHWLFYDA